MSSFLNVWCVESAENLTTMFMFVTFAFRVQMLAEVSVAYPSLVVLVLVRGDLWFHGLMDSHVPAREAAAVRARSERRLRLVSE